MGQFIGHTGGFFILAAAVLIAGIFTVEAGLVKKSSFAKIAGTAAYTTAAGIIYYLLIAYIRNLLFGRTNAFDFPAVFGFCGMDKMIELYSAPAISEMFSGFNMPLFPILTHIAGRLVFGQYAGAAVWLNFFFAAAGMCCVRRMADEFFEKSVPHITFMILILPYMFLMFTPGPFGVVFGLISAAAYALYRKNMPVYAVFAVAAVLSGKLGFAVLIPLILSKIPALPALIRRAANSAVFKNPYIRLGLVFLLAVLDGAIMFLTIGGVNI